MLGSPILYLKAILLAIAPGASRLKSGISTESLKTLQTVPRDLRVQPRKPFRLCALLQLGFRVYRV